ncbi:MAG: ankyrin repeat domain-containing protein [Candidatus Babeliales bacterium]
MKKFILLLLFICFLPSIGIYSMQDQNSRHHPRQEHEDSSSDSDSESCDSSSDSESCDSSRKMPLRLDDEESIEEENSSIDALNNAIVDSRLDLVKHHVLEKNIDPNSKNEDGVAPLHIAASSGSRSIIEFFVNLSDINLNIQDAFGDTPLHIALSCGFTDIAKLLLIKGAQTNIRNDREQTPIFCLLERFFYEIIIDEDEDNSLIKIDSNGIQCFYELIDVLAECGAKFFYLDYEGRTLLDLVIIKFKERIDAYGIEESFESFPDCLYDLFLDLIKILVIYDCAYPTLYEGDEQKIALRKFTNESLSNFIKDFPGTLESWSYSLTENIKNLIRIRQKLSNLNKLDAIEQSDLNRIIINVLPKYHVYYLVKKLIEKCGFDINNHELRHTMMHTAEDSNNKIMVKFFLHKKFNNITKSILDRQISGLLNKKF